MLFTAHASAAWTVSTGENKMDETTKLFLITNGDQPYPTDWRPRSPTLTIRCENGKPEVIVDAKVILHSSSAGLHQHHVRMKFDNGKPERFTASESTNSQAAFLPNPRAMIARFMKAKSVMIELEPYRYAPATSTFDIAGLDAHKQTLSKHCGIK
jgi:hypothetical protein